MIKFFKNNFEIILKLFVDHIGMMMFGLVVLIATKIMENAPLFYIMGIVAIAMYWFILYIALWEKGANDKLRIDAGRQKRNNLYGLYVALCANSINIILALLTFITSFFTKYENGFINGVYGVCKVIVHYFNAIYLMITTQFIGYDGVQYIYLLIIVPTLLVCMLSYLAGVSGMRCLVPEKKRK